jgi:hypothetical protein
MIEDSNSTEGVIQPLTKREQFAMAAMQGILSNYDMGSFSADERTIKDLSFDSVVMADALLKALEATK